MLNYKWLNIVLCKHISQRFNELLYFEEKGSQKQPNSCTYKCVEDILILHKSIYPHTWKFLPEFSQIKEMHI